MLITAQQIDEINLRPMKVMKNGSLIKEYEGITIYNYFKNSIFMEDLFKIKGHIKNMKIGITEEEPHQYFIDFDDKYKVPNPRPKGCFPCVNYNCNGWYDPNSSDNSNGECWICTETRNDRYL